MFFHCFHVLQRESALCRASGAGSGRSHLFLHGDISDYSATASFALLGWQVREPTRALASGSGVLAPLEELFGPVFFFFSFPFYQSLSDRTLLGVVVWVFLG